MQNYMSYCEQGQRKNLQVNTSWVNTRVFIYQFAFQICETTRNFQKN